MYTLHLADRIEELFNIGVACPKIVIEEKNIEYDTLGDKDMDDFYQFANDRIF